jgi:hypothetical protein
MRRFARCGCTGAAALPESGIFMRAALLLIAALSVVALPAKAGAEPVARKPYYIEFRARTGGILGHAYMTYGRLDSHGRPIDRRYAGLYPDDNYEDALMSFGPLVVAPAFIGSEAKDQATPPSVVYRRPLNAQEFAHLLWVLRVMRSQHPRWNLMFHSCNDFVGEVARELRLVIPLSWGSPTVFIRTLRAMNER